MEIRGIGSTTHRDLHGHKLTKEDLEILAKQHYGDGKVKISQEHDPTIPPSGKWLDAWVEPTEDGEYQLAVVGEIFENEERITLADGTDVIKRQSATNRQAFVGTNHYNAPQSEVTLHYNPINFGSQKEQEKFLEDIGKASELPFFVGRSIRKGLILDPISLLR